ARMLAELDQIRLGLAERKEGQLFDFAGTDRRYAAAFSDYARSSYGLDIATAAPAEGAPRGRGPGIREAPLAGRGAWGGSQWGRGGERGGGRGGGGGGRGGVGGGADDSAWGGGLGEAAWAGDAPTLKALAGQAVALSQPPNMLDWLGSVLEHAGLSEEAAAVLR